MVAASLFSLYSRCQEFRRRSRRLSQGALFHRRLV